ncbi:KH domain-containing protein [Alkalicella caledoniensis]|uniref:RNA-binding protein KhpA n=1 Tax=Alkalicella caledoniensis TaxID=2731377 RepID=A0A7G9WCH1_ALKCA|nr:KH domain-containing protein [Alkalicella caledoniensis]QNO16383.1 KH domain-containing protein [Alkalicella caledoniensis]
MKELVEFLAKSLVDNPEQVVVTQRQREKTMVLELKVAQEDMGKVIGKSGKIAKAMRTVVNAAAARNNVDVVVDILG